MDEIVTREDSTVENDDLGPCPRMTQELVEPTEDVPVFGYVDLGGKSNCVVSPDSQQIAFDLRASIKASPKKAEIAVDWPKIDDVAVNEYGDRKIFVNAFPWLFPGGLGDACESPLTKGEWGKMMLYYEDGRFAEDSLFTFYVTNYVVRHRNTSGGRWYVDKFKNSCPETVEDLKQSIEDGHTGFINTLSYYNQRVKGSTPYWLKKRSELYTWINHHIEKGNGAPMFFITLSCAEYYWPDIISLIKERLEIAGRDTAECYVGSKKMTKLVNEYSIVIQEYFQRRVEIWLETVGHKLFGIEHYWVRYEFAPGRGQIHAHLLAIPKDQSIYELCYSVRKEVDGDTKRAEYMAEWASKKFGLTASVEPGFDAIQVDKSESPSMIRFSSLSDDPVARSADTQKLMKHVQEHGCSGFCMRTGNKNT